MEKKCWKSKYVIRSNLRNYLGNNYSSLFRISMCFTTFKINFAFCVGCNFQCNFNLFRLYSDNIILVANEVGRKPPTFLDAAKVAREVAKYDFTSGKIFYNRFKYVTI